MTIGGYFELELKQGHEYHPEALKLNTGRNAFEYVLIANKYRKVYLPFYTCKSMLEPIKKLKLDYSFYSIDKNFYPKIDFNVIQNKEVLVYTNYFGICDKQVYVTTSMTNNLVIDNSQAFFSKPLPTVDTFYSPRKFFGLPDGAYLYTDNHLDIELEHDISLNRFQHLLGRIDFCAEEFFHSFKSNEKNLSDQPINLMSNITRRFLKSIDYNWIMNRRRANFFYLHEKLEKTNSISFNLIDDFVPMVYPYFIKQGLKLRQKLIENRVFVASYWPNVGPMVNKKSVEADFVQNLVALPIDQRYGYKEMEYIFSLISKYA